MLDELAEAQALVTLHRELVTATKHAPATRFFASRANTGDKAKRTTAAKADSAPAKETDEG